MNGSRRFSDIEENANVEKNALSIMIKLKKETLIKALLSVHLFKILLALATSINKVLIATMVTS